MSIRSNPPESQFEEAVLLNGATPTPYDIPDNVNLVSVNRGTSAIVIRLPNPALHYGRRITIKRHLSTDTGTITIQCVVPGNQLQTAALVITSSFNLNTAASGLGRVTFQVTPGGNRWEVVAI